MITKHAAACYRLIKNVGSPADVKCVARWILQAQARLDKLETKIKGSKKAILEYMESVDMIRLKDGRLTVRLDDPLLLVKLPAYDTEDYDRLIRWCEKNAPHMVKIPKPHSSSLGKLYRDNMKAGIETPPVEVTVKERVHIDFKKGSTK